MSDERYPANEGPLITSREARGLNGSIMRCDQTHQVQGTEVFSWSPYPCIHNVDIPKGTIGQMDGFNLSKDKEHAAISIKWAHESLPGGIVQASYETQTELARYMTADSTLRIEDYENACHRAEKAALERHDDSRALLYTAKDAPLSIEGSPKHREMSERSWINEQEAQQKVQQMPLAERAKLVREKPGIFHTQPQNQEQKR